MDVKMHSIMAGPDGCADAGQVVSLSPAAAESLIKGGFASMAKLPARETAMIDPRDIQQREREAAAQQAKDELARKSADAVRAALDRLDPGDDEDWTAGGKPAMHRVKELTGSATLTRAELDGLFPDFVRPDDTDIKIKVDPAAVLPTDTAAPAKSGPRTNRA
ncbi:hypothetical protein [Pararhodobacter zhoushanensis]|uniref:Mu-like prophage I protein n=1 Tax=Pararhodobacter zhoushanensis TaxID=2479545 RepID=A0ABT3GYJ6_9RHOB|nr:hypothetical protein [Pararhodobacter zhoushanensis]MCW1932618.1 hypothetical protein [Pararhodobacter zhoushanensis]